MICDVPRDVIFLIGEQCDFYTLVQLRLTCHNISSVLECLVESRKTKLFQNSCITDNETGVIFVPGPAIEGLPNKYPLKGVYFFECDSLCFFFHHFSEWLHDQESADYIATIDTEDVR